MVPWGVSRIHKNKKRSNGVNWWARSFTGYGDERTPDKSLVVKDES